MIKFISNFILMKSEAQFQNSGKLLKKTAKRERDEFRTQNL